MINKAKNIIEINRQKYTTGSRQIKEKRALIIRV